MGQNLSFQKFSVLFNFLLVRLVEFDSMNWFLFFVVGVKSHSVEVESFSWGQVDVVLFFAKGSFDSLFSLKLFVANFDQKTYHFPDLMIDEALAYESES